MSDLNNFLTKEKEKIESNGSKKELKIPKIVERRERSFSLEELSKNEIIDLLDPLMARIPEFISNMAWTRQKILPQNPKISPDELAVQLKIPLLEAYVILAKLKRNSQ